MKHSAGRDDSDKSLLSILRLVVRTEAGTGAGRINFLGLVGLFVVVFIIFAKSLLTDLADAGVAALGQEPPDRPDPIAALIWLVVAVLLCVALAILNDRVNPPSR